MPKSSFAVGKNNFEEIAFVRVGKTFGGFRWKDREAMVDYFILDDRLPTVFCGCKVTVVNQSGHLTPRLAFSIRNRKLPKEIGTEQIEKTEETRDVRASVDLTKCHENFWDLISYLKSLRELEVPDKFYAVDVRTHLTRVVSSYQQFSDAQKRELEKALSDQPDLGQAITNLAESRFRQQRLKEFEDGMAKEEPETWWKEFFDKNRWIFGYGLDYRISHMEASQAYVSGADLSGRGGPIVDYAFSTEGDARFMVFLEIKTPMSKLIMNNEVRKGGAWRIAQQLTDALSQTLADVEHWLDKSREQHIVRDLAYKDIHSVKPKALIVIGHLKQLEDENPRIRDAKLRTFELFRQSLHGVEVITYDELYARASYIAQHVHPASREYTQSKLLRLGTRTTSRQRT
jgi:hypothetical protein